MPHTIDELRLKQAAPLNVKVKMTQQRIREWVNYFGEDGVYISFPGGKDSTVLLHLVRDLYPNIPAVFCDTGLEYPEIREFVKTFDNVEWLRPKMTFRQVIEKYGYPFISKETSMAVWLTRRNIEKGKRIEDTYKGRELLGTTLTSRGNPSFYNKQRWAFLLEAPFYVSSECCAVMKKKIANKYSKETGRVRITGMMAQESMNRTAQWLRVGCNAFDQKSPCSNPMSFWNENDVLQFIKSNGIKICSVYGDIVEADELPGQMTLDDFGFDTGGQQLKTTGCQRTGCMFCGYGCHLEKPGEGRFERMKITHPKQYEYIMKPWNNGGLGYKDVIDWLNENGNLGIKY